jgi:hypothetical protein
MALKPQSRTPPSVIGLDDGEKTQRFSARDGRTWDANWSELTEPG